MTMSRAVYAFEPYNVGRWIIWSLFAMVLLAAPWVFKSNLAHSMLSQMGIAMIACLAYNLLLGQGGMLSFGHAVYTGLGGYLAMHALNAVSAGSLSLPVSLIPLVGGAGGLFFACLLGYVTTRKSGTTFAMITLGMAELVSAMSLMFSEFFGGEAGVSGNRVAGTPFMGINFGPQIQVYYLIALYTFVCVALLFAFTRTPLGRILNAVRDNPERVRRLWVAYVGLGVLAVIALLSAGAWIEMVYHLQLNSALGPTLKFAGMTLDALSVRSWFGAGFVLVTALGLFELARRQYRRDWDEIQVQIEQEIKRREAL
jgi:ABC-type branched-subunit amino acid transport system permease subunit